MPQQRSFRELFDRKVTSVFVTLSQHCDQPCSPFFEQGFENAG